MKAACQGATAIRSVPIGAWTLLEYLEVGSTNLLAATLPAWHAVRAERQTSGRGRFQRTWVSDAGGLWISAVVPTADPARRALLPLATGLAVIETLHGFQVTDLRLRWPNDVMTLERKLAGILVDGFDPGRAVIGVGINILNAPAVQDAQLANTAIRLADLLPAPPRIEEVARAFLNSLRRVVLELETPGGPASLCHQLNALWGPPRRVRLDLDGVESTGWFLGVDEAGNLLLRDDDAAAKVRTLAAHQVRLLREL